jgi:hypothetical protein
MFGACMRCHLATKDINCRAEIVLAAARSAKGVDPERTNRVLEKGKTACLVTASLAVPVHLQAEILAEA